MRGARLVSPLLIAIGLSATASPASAQVQRSAGNEGTVQAAPNALRLPADPLQTEVKALRIQVDRLEGALQSLRATLRTHQEAYAKHRHGIPSYGIVTAKSICPDTPAIEGTMLVYTHGSPVKGSTGLPE